MDGTIQILDVKERCISSDDAVKPPKPPVAAGNGGFPEHKKRVSAFKRQRQAGGGANITTTMLSRDIGGPSSPSSRSQAAAAAAAATRPQAQADDDNTENKDEAERRRIDKENRDMLASMSAQEIADMQRELYNGLDPRLIQMLLRRANLDDGGGGGQNDDDPFATDKPPTESVVVVPEIKITDTAVPQTQTERNDKTEEDKPVKQEQKKPKKTVSFDPDVAAPATPSQPEDAEKDVPSSGDVHFPTPPRVPDLDPSDPDFLNNLHNKFFPDLPSDPSKLAWMAPIPTPDSIADRDSPYYPGQESLPVSALRFDFRGALIPPKLSRTIPVTKGLHHHGEAPEAAGYTIPELARLARSAVAAQRCIAFQTLGRMLYRLGKGEWGYGKGGRDGEEDDLAFALWRCFREGKVLESLQEAANVPDGQGHLSSKMYATEALWLFEKGGWRERWRGM
ncbi:RPAP1-like protein [Diplogelasinospora grovesii]|uniref:RPAP1-like protein n=1 Tax=Diplogelasinospora grovesii TaxID=303347 RepID=A0AAN6NA53_9PEZI|nr:RPAP1-like protein [Diplogelasinospora grovesii]